LETLAHFCLSCSWLCHRSCEEPFVTQEANGLDPLLAVVTLCVCWNTIDAKQLSHLFQCLNIHFNLLFVKADVNVSGFLSVLSRGLPCMVDCIFELGSPHEPSNTRI
jgi:hypothetical protein